jgi:hypothetical protein
LLAQVSQATGRTHIHVTTLPKSTEAGNPDFRLWNGTDRIIGYVEAKKPSDERLDHIEASNQLRRYRNTFPNLILTNFLEFRLYQHGETVDSVQIARPYVLNKIHTAPPLENLDRLWALFDRFLSFSLPVAYTAESLAIDLAKRTRFLREVVTHQLAEEMAGNAGMLAGFYEAFQRFLIGNLNPEDFADLYAQTITYGLFAARTRAQNGFNRRTALRIPPHDRHPTRCVPLHFLGEPPIQLEDRTTSRKSCRGRRNRVFWRYTKKAKAAIRCNISTRPSGAIRPRTPAAASLHT